MSQRIAILLALGVLALAACIPGTPPLPGTTPDAIGAARIGFQKWASIPYRNLDITALTANDDLARFRFTAEFNQDGTWLEQQTEVAVNRIGYDWQPPSGFAFRNTPKGQATAQAAATATGYAVATRSAATAFAQQTATSIAQTALAESRLQTATAQAISSATAQRRATENVQATQVALATAVAGATQTRAADPSYVQPFVVDVINKANRAYIDANWSLNPNELPKYYAKGELDGNVQKIAENINNNIKRKINLDRITITSFKLDNPDRATVTTQETWSSDNYQRNPEKYLSRSPSISYNETYVVEKINGSWYVTQNDYEIVSQVGGSAAATATARANGAALPSRPAR